MARLRQRQQEQIVQKVLRRVSPAAGGSAPAPVTGVSSYNGRTGAVVSTLTDVPAHKTTHQSGGSDEISVAGLTGVLANPQPPIIGAGAAQAVAGNDARLTDARTPLAHKTSHQNGGSDQINVAGLSGLLATAQTPAAHASTHQPGGSDAMAVDAVAATGSLRTLGSGAQQAASGTDSRLSDARTPLAHAPTHKSGGTDAIKLDELAAPTDILNLNADTSKHGLLPKLPGGTATFLRADGAFAAPVASLSLSTVECNVAPSPQTRRSGHVQITGLAGLTVGKPVLVQQAAGPYTGKGTRTDEAEMDMLIVAGVVLNATTIDLYWQSKYQVHGNFKFNYAVAA